MSELASVMRWALAQLGAAPDATRAAEASLARAIAALEATVWPGAVPWFSDLNADGCPVELAFGSRDRAIRITAEAAPPEVRADARLGHALRLLEACGARPTPPAIRSWLQRVHRPVRWGAAIGMRHDGRDRYKLYAEAGGDTLLAAARLVRPPALVMVGWEAGGDVVEHYAKSVELAPGELGRILELAGLGDRQRELEHAVARAWQGSCEAALARTWGISVAGPLGDRPTTVSLFKEANHVLGGDAATRANVLALVAALDAGTLEDYERVSRPLAGLAGSGAHGMLAFMVSRGRPLELRIGLSPAAAWRAAQQRAAA